MPKNKTTLPAKLSRPRLTSNVLLRKRLFSALESGLKKRAIWVSGPPGAGKTTLVNSFIESRKLKTLWYQIDGADTDVATLFHYLGTLAGSASRKGSPMPRYSPEAASNLALFSSRYFLELFSRIRQPFTLVFDNFQEASDDPRFIEAVYAGMKETPVGSALILISRTEPPSAFARSCVNAEMGVVCWDDMRLTEREALDVAGLLSPRVLNRKGLKDLHSKAEGWMAGLLLLLEQAKTGAGSVKEISGGATGSAFNYFMAEVFDKIDHVSQGFLLRSALFQEMTPDMATEISGEKDASKILSSLNAGNFFVAKRISPRVSYQYHPLFRDFLLAKAKEVFGTDYLKALMSTAARISEEAGQIDEAAGLLMEACDWHGLRKFIHSHGASFISQGRLKALEDMLRAVPDDLMKGSPWLLYYLGVCLLPASPAGARERFQSAYKVFESVGEPDGLFLAWTGMVDTVLYEWKDFKALDHLIDEFDRLVTVYGGFPSKDIELRATSCIFSALMFRQPEHPDLRKWEERVKAMALSSKNEGQSISVTRNLILYYLWTGNIAKAAVIVDSLKLAAKSADSDPLARLMWLRSAALYNLFTPRIETAFASLQDGLRLAEETGIHLMDQLFYGVGIYACMVTHDMSVAEDFLEKIRKGLRAENCADILYYHHQVSVVEWRKGNIHEALEHAGIAWNFIVESGTKINAGIYQAVLIYLMIEAERFEGVEGLISDMRSFGRAVKSHLHEPLGLLAEAFLAFKKGDEVLFLRSFEKTLRILKENGMGAVAVMFRASSLAAMCARALEKGMEPALVQDIVLLNNLKEYHPDPWIEEWPWEVKIYTFGCFEIRRDGRKIESSRKAQQKPLAMLKAIIALGGRDVSQETVIDALWPDSDGDTAYNAFATTLHRLRRLIGNDRAIQSAEGMLSIDPLICWVDVRGFTGLLKLSEAEAGGDRRKAAVLVEKAIGLYRGPFLAGEAIACLVPARERLRARFLKQISLLASECERSGEVDRAIELYNRGLEEDELVERFYQGLMLCHLKDGNRGEALRAYKRCKTVFSNVMGISPSAETEAIFKRLA